MSTQVVAPPGLNDKEFNALIQDLSHTVWEIRRDACEELGSRPDPRSIPHLVRAMSDSVGAVRYAAVESLGKMGDRSVAPHIMRLLDNAGFGSLAPVIEALANLKSPEAIPYFIRLLRDEDPRVRNVSASALMVTTRQVIPFKAKGTPEERETGVKLWETWWAANGGAAKK